jgi:hypothetical protein
MSRCAAHLGHRDLRDGKVDCLQHIEGARVAGLRRCQVGELARTSRSLVTYLFGAVENDVEVGNYLDRVVCLVADDDSLWYRLVTRTTNHFGKHADELAKILEWNRTYGEHHRRIGATSGFV